MSLLNKLKQKYIFNFGSTKRRFEEIYKSNFWASNESISGPGSQLDKTITIREELPRIIEKFQIKTLLDLPCGDFYWMSRVNLKGVHYIGGDIVTNLIKLNNDKYQNDNIIFKELNLISDSLPKVDAILVRDCFIHLSEKQILEALKNIKTFGIKFLITNNFPDFERNFDIKTGMFRKVNFSSLPYILDTPIFEVEEKEHYSDVDGRKMISVYMVDSLK
ncbi:MAG: class I SAM-dependent methyltransferase [Algoriphagus sp.]|nr:class I SAM-dependent methyltransferase [Algoriphagus sp.]